MNFRELVAELESRDELLHVRETVSADYELPALLHQAETRDKACRFDSVAGADHPVVGGLLTSRRRLALALGQPESAFEARDALENHVAASVAAPLPAAITTDGPVHENVVGGSAGLSGLPVPRFFSGDSHPFITAALGFALDPDTGLQNTGFYRIPVLDDQRVCVSAGPTSDLRRIYDRHREQGTSMQIALAVGVPPALQMAAACDLPADVSEAAVAGALCGSSLEYTQCRTSELTVPADAEFVIELTVDPQEWTDNTMGEYGDQFGKTAAPVATVQSVS